MPDEKQFWGATFGSLTDKFGNFLDGQRRLITPPPSTM